MRVEILIECCNCISFCASLHAHNVLIAPQALKLLKLLSFAILAHKTLWQLELIVRKSLENVSTRL